MDRARYKTMMALIIVLLLLSSCGSSSKKDKKNKKALQEAANTTMASGFRNCTESESCCGTITVDVGNLTCTDITCGCAGNLTCQCLNDTLVNGTCPVWGCS